MNPTSDTLTISSRGNQRNQELPIAAVERAEDRAHRPEAAEQARARISALTEPRIDPALAHVQPLVTDKQLLATQLRSTSVPKIPLTVPKVKRPTIPARFQPLAVAVGVFLIALIAFKLPVIISQLGYHNNDTSSQLVVPGSTTQAVAVTANPTLVIPKINVNAPVVYVGSNDETQVLAGLENGIVHYANTAMPGQNGNAVFFGHSSNDWWEPGNYKFVFVLLDKLAVGDKFEVDYQSQRYTYEVTGTKVVDPTEVGVLAQTSTPTATLITCSPPGTSWRRLVVSAKQISPAPSTTNTTAPTNTSGSALTSIPGSAPSWWTQITNAVGSLFGKKPATTTTTTGSSGAATLPDVK